MSDNSANGTGGAVLAAAVGFLVGGPLGAVMAGGATKATQVFLDKRYGSEKDK